MPHAPQLSVSDVMSLHDPPQIVWPEVAHTHFPAVHVVPYDEHALPQLPQLETSVDRSAHAPLHAVILDGQVTGTFGVAPTASAEPGSTQTCPWPSTNLHTCPSAQSTSLLHGKKAPWVVSARQPVSTRSARTPMRRIKTSPVR